MFVFAQTQFSSFHTGFTYVPASLHSGIRLGLHKGPEVIFGNYGMEFLVHSQKWTPPPPCNNQSYRGKTVEIQHCITFSDPQENTGSLVDRDRGQWEPHWTQRDGGLKVRGRKMGVG